MVNKKSISIIANTSWYLFNFRIKLIADLIKIGFRVVTIVPDSSYSAQLEAVGCEVVIIRSLRRKGLNPFSNWKLKAEFRKILLSNNIDLTINYTIKPIIFGSLAIEGTNVKAISILSGLGSGFLKDGWLRMLIFKLYRWALKKNAFVFFENEDDLNLFVNEKLIEKRKTKLVNGAGVDIEFYKPIPKQVVSTNKLEFLLIGRLLKDKGIIEFIEAANYFKGQHVFKILGAIDQDNPTTISKSEIDKWNKSALVQFISYKEDVRDDIANADVIVLPSYREGMPKSILEAMSMSKPVIVTDVPGCRQTVEDGVNGFKVEARNSESLIQGMKRMVKLSPEERKNMGIKGRISVIAKYEESKIIQVYLDAIADVLNLNLMDSINSSLIDKTSRYENNN